MLHGPDEGRKREQRPPHCPAWGHGEPRREWWADYLVPEFKRTAERKKNRPKKRNAPPFLFSFSLPRSEMGSSPQLGLE